MRRNRFISAELVTAMGRTHHAEVHPCPDTAWGRTKLEAVVFATCNLVIGNGFGYVRCKKSGWMEPCRVSEFSADTTSDFMVLLVEW